MLLAALAIAAPAAIARGAWEPLTGDSRVWSSPVVTATGEVLAIAGDRVGAHLEKIVPGQAASASGDERGVIRQIAFGSSVDAPFVIRSEAIVGTLDSADSLVRVGGASGAGISLLHAGVGERLADPAISPDGRWIALMVRREPRARGRTLSTQLLLMPTVGGVATVVDQGEGDRFGPSFTGDGTALLFVRREGEYSELARVALASDGTLAAPAAVVHRDRASWGRPVALDAAGKRVIVARDLGHGPSLWIIEVGTLSTTRLTPVGRAALQPALAPDGRTVVFAAASGGGIHLFRTGVDAAPDRDAAIAISAAEESAEAGTEPADERADDAARFDEARAGTANQPCLACHDHERGLDVIGSSVHAKLLCTDCHVDVTETPHRSIARNERIATDTFRRGLPVDAAGKPRPAIGLGLRGLWRPLASATAASVACGSCHAKEARSWSKDSHGRGFDELDGAAPGCATCHGDHDVWPEKDPRSRVAAEKIADTCGASCHDGYWQVRHDQFGYGIPLMDFRSDPLGTYSASIHAKKLRLGADDAATCTSCHTAHSVRDPLDPRSSLHPANAAATCAGNGKCHVGADGEMVKLFDHEVARPEGKTPRQHAELAFSIVGGGTLLWAVADVMLDLLRRLTGRRRREGPASAGSKRSNVGEVVRP